jgi:hypothetical protein
MIRRCLNDPLWEWCQERRIPLSRSRPDKKNDSAWVEQKNWTHVRKVVGYRRFDTTSELRLLIEITAVLPLYKNFCLPTIRLQSKTRGQGRIKVYDRPCTPYERITVSPQVERKTKRLLQDIYERLNPAKLYRRLTELREPAPASLKDMANRPIVEPTSASASVAIQMPPLPNNPKQQAGLCPLAL